MEMTNSRYTHVPTNYCIMSLACACITIDCVLAQVIFYTHIIPMIKVKIATVCLACSRNLSGELLTQSQEFNTEATLVHQPTKMMFKNF